jgi:hypothetical protein
MRDAASTPRWAAVLVATVLANLAWGFEVPKPTASMDFGANGDYERGSDTAQVRTPPYRYSFSLSGSVNWWVFSAGLNLLYNSEDRFTAQRVNNFGLTPEWKWGRVYLGDFSPTISEFTLSGTPLYGYGIELFPGPFRLTALSGQSRRVATDTTEWSYNRQLYGFKLGFEQFALSVVRVADDTNSNNIHDSVSVPPEENLVAGLSSRANLLKGLSLETEAAGSFYTRDMRSQAVVADEIPGWVFKLYQPRYSSSADFALRAGLRFSIPALNLGLAVAQVGPGFTSLGLGFIKNDYRYARLSASTPVIPKTTVDLSLETGQDNIAGDKLATASSDDIRLAVNVAPGPVFSVATSYGISRLRKDAVGDSFDMNTLTQLGSLSPSLSLQFWRISQTFCLSANYQDFQNQSPLGQVGPSRDLTFALNYSLTPGIPITLTMGIGQTYNLVTRSFGKLDVQQNYGLGFSKALFNDRLQNSLSVAVQPAPAGTNIPVSGNHSFSLTTRDAFNLGWSVGVFRSAVPEVDGFNAQRASLSYSRKLF